MRNLCADFLIMRNAFSDAECDELIELAEEMGWDRGMTQKAQEGRPEHRIVRESDCARIRKGVLVDKMEGLMRDVNEQGYHFSLSVFEAMQVARYREGDYFDWHIDMQSQGAMQRKLSAVILLSDPDDFEGGEFEFWGTEEKPPLTDRGQFLAFPAWRPHRVAPVTSGVRYSVTLWCFGPRFV